MTNHSAVGEKLKVRREAEAWCRVNDVASHLDVSASWVHKAVQRGEIPVHRVGRSLRFKLSEVDRWIDQHGAAHINDS